MLSISIPAASASTTAPRSCAALATSAAGKDWPVTLEQSGSATSAVLREMRGRMRSAPSSQFPPGRAICTDAFPFFISSMKGSMVL